MQNASIYYVIWYSEPYNGTTRDMNAFLLQPDTNITISPKLQHCTINYTNIYARMSHYIHTLHCYCTLHTQFSYSLDFSFHPSLLLSLFAASFYWCLLFPSFLPFLTSTCSPLQNSVLILFRSWLLFSPFWGEYSSSNPMQYSICMWAGELFKQIFSLNFYFSFPFSPQSFLLY